MAKHVRQQIREAAKVALTGLPTTGARVYSSDPYPRVADDGPYLVLAAPEDVNDDDLSDIGRIGGRRLTLIVVGQAEAIAIEDVLDAIGLEVEAVLEGCTFGGLVKTTSFARVTKDFEDGAKKRVGEIRLEFVATYRVARGAPDISV